MAEKFLMSPSPTTDPRAASIPSILDAVWPVGSIFITIGSDDPADLLEFGTWAKVGAGRTLIGIDTGDADFDTAEKTGGAKTVASTGSIAAHPTDAMGTPVGTEAVVTGTTHSYTGSASSVVQPFYCVTFWKRTA